MPAMVSPIQSTIHNAQRSFETGQNCRIFKIYIVNPEKSSKSCLKDVDFIRRRISSALLSLYLSRKPLQ